MWILGEKRQLSLPHPILKFKFLQPKAAGSKPDPGYGRPWGGEAEAREHRRRLDMSVMRVFRLKPGDMFLQTEHKLSNGSIGAHCLIPRTLGLYASHLEPGGPRKDQPASRQTSQPWGHARAGQAGKTEGTKQGGLRSRLLRPVAHDLRLELHVELWLNLATVKGF